MDGIVNALTSISWPTALVIDEAVRIMPYDPSNYIGEKLMPEVSRMADRVVYQEIYGANGMTNAHVLTGDPKPIKFPRVITKEFNPGYFKEYFPIAEDDLIRLAMMAGTPFQHIQAQQLVSEALNHLKIRNLNRKEWLRWEIFFNGKVSISEEDVVFEALYGFDLALQFDLPVAVVWSNRANSTALTDLLGMPAKFIGSGFTIGTVVMNSDTALDFCLSEEVRDHFTGMGIMETVLPGNLEKFGKLVIPNTEWIISDQGYENSSGVFTKHIPDHKILFKGKESTPGQICDLVSTVNVHSPSGAPTPGDFAFMIDKTGQKDKNPKIEVVSGWYGLPRVRRPKGIMTMNTDTTT